MMITTTLYHETTILGGLPVIVEYTIFPAEPDVGIMSDYIGHMALFTPRRQRAKWAENRMKDSDWDRLQEKCWRHYSKTLAVA